MKIGLVYAMTGEIESHAADLVILATGGYGNVYFLSTNAMASNVTAAWRAHKRGAGFANPSSGAYYVLDTLTLIEV